jgi:uncharacterized protein YeaO (DUF488 family)
MIKLKRAYDEPAKADGHRILVDRLWPRGVTKEALQIETWARDVAPSTALRKWFHGGKPGEAAARWPEFKRRYLHELAERQEAVEAVFGKLRGTITLVYGAKDSEHNHAAILKDYLER